jgi:hypothetical protein
MSDTRNSQVDAHRYPKSYKFPRFHHADPSTSPTTGSADAPAPEFAFDAFAWNSTSSRFPTNGVESAHSHGVFSMRLSTGATSGSRSDVVRRLSAVAVVGLLYSGIGTACPPSVVLTLTSGEAVTITSKVEEETSLGPGVDWGGVREW